VDIREKMNPCYADMRGGLLSTVVKADVGTYYADLAKQGVTMLSAADPFRPDASTPPVILEEMLKAIDTGAGPHYTTPMGNYELKVEIARKLMTYNNMEADPKRNIIVTPGSDIGLYYAMLPFVSPGDEVMIPDPSYPNNFWNVKLMGGVQVPVPLKADENYRLDVPEFKKRLTPKTKMVVLTHPNNPTTTVFRRENLEEFAEFIVDNDLVLVVDHAFEDFIFDGVEFVSPASLPGMWERTVSVFSVSKGMGLSGYRVGYIVADEKAMDVYYGCAVYVVSAAHTATQRALVAAFRETTFMDEYYEVFDRRRKVVHEIVNSIPGVSMSMPESGFLTWMDVSRLGSSGEICSLLISEAKVATNDGLTYGQCGAGHLRVVHGCFQDDQTVYDAFERIKSTLVKRAMTRPW
jgi:aspartate/methionine/tyrosine aminotransferase